MGLRPKVDLVPKISSRPYSCRFPNPVLLPQRFKARCIKWLACKRGITLASSITRLLRPVSLLPPPTFPFRRTFWPLCCCLSRSSVVLRFRFGVTRPEGYRQASQTSLGFGFELGCVWFALVASELLISRYMLGLLFLILRPTLPLVLLLIILVVLNWSRNNRWSRLLRSTL